MQLHVPTLLLSTIFASFAVAVVLPFARSGERGDGVREATLAAWSLIGACVLLMLRDALPPGLRVVGNALMWLTFTLQWMAFRRFDDPRASAHLPLGLWAVAVGGFAAASFLGADYRERSAIASIVIAAFMGAAGRQLVSNGGLRRERSRIIGASIAVVTVLCQLARLPLLAALPPGESNLLGNGLEQSIAFLPAMLYALGVGLGFLMMHHERSEARIREAALTDPLTGCANRRAFAEHVAAAQARLARGGGALSLVLTDIDRFKSVNDTHGHATGDAVIRHFAQILCDGVRGGDVVARIGGEEFCVLVHDGDARAAELLAARLRESLRARPVDADGVEVRVTASFGVAAFAPREPWEAVFARADRALYAAKQGGRDRVAVA